MSKKLKGHISPLFLKFLLSYIFMLLRVTFAGGRLYHDLLEVYKSYNDANEALSCTETANTKTIWFGKPARDDPDRLIMIRLQ